jgi:ribose transport system substrate-binding protein
MKGGQTVARRLNKVLLINIFMLVFLSGCYANIQTSSDLDGKRLKFGASYMNMNNPFFIKINDGIKKVVESNNGKLIALDSQLDINKQLAQIDDLIAQKVDIIFLNPVDWKAVKPALLAARKANVPVIVVDAPVYDDSLVTSTIVSDNYNAGILCAQDLVKRLNEKGNIVVLDHPTAKSAMDRIEGFVSTVESFSGINIVVKDTSNGQLEIAMDTMARIMKTTRSFDAVMCLNDPTAMGVIAALENSNKKEKVLVYGIDGSGEAIRMIENGSLTATAAQFPSKIGKVAAETALKKLKGEAVEHEIKIPVELIDKENLSKYYEN